MKINKRWLVPVFVALVFLIVVVWALTASRKKKAPVAPPGAVSDVKAKPVDGIPRNSTVSTYAESLAVNKVGLLVNFKTPSSSGVPGYPSIKSYIISLRNSTIADTKEYLTSTSFIAGGTGTGTPPAYEWKDGAGGTAEGSIPAELFISSSLFNGLVDGQSYIIGIKAVNSKNISAVSESVSGYIEYNTCKLGLQGACGWAAGNISGVGTQTTVSQSITRAADSSETGGSFMGNTTIEGTPCDGDKVVNTLYKINSAGACVAEGCTRAGDFLIDGVCTHKFVAGDECEPGKIYYNTNTSIENPELVCDSATSPLDPRISEACVTWKGSSLPPNAKWKNGFPSCAIICINTSFGPTCSETIPVSGISDSIVIQTAGSSTYALGSYISNSGETITSSTNTNIASFPLLRNDNMMFGKTGSVYGVYEIKDNSYTVPVWEVVNQLSLFRITNTLNNDKQGLFILGNKKFIFTNSEDEQIVVQDGSTTTIKEYIMPHDKILQLGSDGSLIFKVNKMTVTITPAIFFGALSLPEVNQLTPVFTT